MKSILQRMLDSCDESGLEEFSLEVDEPEIDLDEINFQLQLAADEYRERADK